MLTVLLAVGGAISYGVADFLGGLSARRAHVLKIVAVSAPASLLLEVVAAAILGAYWSGEALLWGVASGIASAAAFALLYAALAVGPMSVIAPMTAVVSAALPVVVGVTLGEALEPLAIAGAALGLIAIVTVTSGSAGQEQVSVRGVCVGLGAGAAIAAQLIALDLAPHESAVTPLLVGRSVSSLILIVALVVVSRRRHLGPSASPGTVVIAAVAGSLDSLANLLFLLASRTGLLSVSAVIVALYPVATVLLATIVLHEPLGRVSQGEVLSWVRLQR